MRPQQPTSARNTAPRATAPTLASHSPAVDAVMLANEAAERASNTTQAVPQATTEGTPLATHLATLEAQRIALGCSRAALARLVGVSPSTIRRALGPLAAHAQESARRSTLHTFEGLRRIEVALALYSRERGVARPVDPTDGTSRGIANDMIQAPAHESITTSHKRTSKPAQAALQNVSATPEGTRIANEDVIAPRSRTHARTVRIAKWLASEQPVDVPHAGQAVTANGEEGHPEFRILVAEDDPATIALYQMVLAEEEDVTYRLDFVQTPADCLERLEHAHQTEPYDLLLTDLGLADIRPDEQRPSLLQHFAHHPEVLPRATLVVSGISPYALQRKRSQLAALHAAFLPKPFDIDELLAVVRALCLVEVLPAACVSFDQASWS